MGPIDIHSHVIPPEMVAEVRAHPRHYQMEIVEAEGKRRLVCPDHDFPLAREFDEVDLKIAAMDRKGLQVSALSVAPIVFGYNWERSLGNASARLINDGIARMASRYPDRLVGLGTLPLGDPEAALEELERIHSVHKFPGIEIGTSVEALHIADARFLPIWSRCQELGLFLFAHPYWCGPKCGLDRFYLINLIGNPLNTVTMVSHLMFSGTLDQLPDLKLVLAHGGGYIPYQLGRLQHGWTWRKECQQHCPTAPEELARRLYYDALTHSPASTRFLIDLAGPQHVMLGTDCPFGMGESDPVGALEQTPGLTATERDWILQGTARGLLGL
jgi:aminocarboxymuconate-semialdehyde decarboxylase